MQVFDFDSAITMHKAWKMKFHLAIDAIRASDFDVQPIGDAAHCALGQWLAANAGELEPFDTARELLAVHRDFHRRCEAIADAIRKGQVIRLDDEAVVEFGVLSEKIEAMLLRLKEELHQAG